MVRRVTSHPKRGPRPADFALTTGELRAVTAFAVASAERVLPAFETGNHAAMAAGDAAASAYLHPLAGATQVGHILRAPAHTLRVLELDPEGAASSSSEIAELASPQVIDVLRRYPRVGPGRDRIGQLVHALDTLLRRAVVVEEQP